MGVWLWTVGVIYVLMGVRLQPFINASQFSRVLTGWRATPDSIEFKAVVDWMSTFGYDLIAIGAVAIAAAAANPAGRSLVVWVVIAREVLGGVAADVWQIKRGYASRRFYSGFIVFHLAVIVSGLLVLR
jgi:hypothetical protein